MNYIDKLREDHPDWSEFEIGYKVGDCCPEAFGYSPEVCDNDCEKCWYKEIPTNMKEKPKKTLAEVLENLSEPHILDSGDRTQFESGAVRDMREGKGRFDVMPLEIISDMLGTKDIRHDPIVSDIATFTYEHDTSWLEAALCNFANRAYNGSLPTMFLDVAKHYEEGAKKYSPDNWRKGIPVWCYIDSAVRHYMKWLRGDKDEHHERGVVWNLMCCIWEVDYSPRAEGETAAAVENNKELLTPEELQKAPGPKERQITVTKRPYSCRLGDYTKGLFEFDCDIYAKINTDTDCGTCVDILTGVKREFHPDIVVTSVDIGEIYTKEGV